MSKATCSVYGCNVVRVIDGDSFVVTGDARAIVPDAQVWAPKVRLAGVDTPERNEPGWGEARSRVTDWLIAGEFTLICYGRDKYGRLLADCERGEGLLSDHMLATGQPVALEAQLA